MSVIAKRPTETVTGVALFALVFPLLSDNGVVPALAAIIAVIVAFGPAAISTVVDRVRSGQ